MLCLTAPHGELEEVVEQPQQPAVRRLPAVSGGLVWQLVEEDAGNTNNQDAQLLYLLRLRGQLGVELLPMVALEAS